MPIPQPLNVKILKTAFSKLGKNAARAFSNRPPLLRLLPYPGINSGTFIGFLELPIVNRPTIDVGIHVVPTAEQSDAFLYFNLITTEELARRRGCIARTLFMFTVPQSHIPANIALAHAANMLLIMGHVQREHGLWNLNYYPAAAKKAGRTTKSLVRPRYVFVGGAPKSGTTWVENILNNHPEIMCHGEGNFFLPPITRSAPKQNLWLPPSLLDSDYGRMTQAAVANMIFGTLHDLWPHKVFADRSPGNSFSYCEIMEAFPQARFVHCVRHPLDVAVSRAFHEAKCMRDGWLPSGELCPAGAEKLRAVIDSPDRLTKGRLFDGNWIVLREILDQWIAIERAFEQAIGRYPPAGIRLHFESLVHNQSTETRRLLRFLDVDSTRNTVAHLGKCTSFEVLSGGRKSGQEDAAAFFRKGIAGDYLHHFTEQQAKDALAYIVLRKNGYQKEGAQ